VFCVYGGTRRRRRSGESVFEKERECGENNKKDKKKWKELQK
jgi:hypothetical protein